MLLEKSLVAAQQAESLHLPVPMASSDNSDYLPAELESGLWFTYWDSGLFDNSTEVDQGMGAPAGLSPLEHVEFCKGVVHPSRNDFLVKGPLEDAVMYEVQTDPADVDQFREREVFDLLHVAQSLQTGTTGWWGNSPKQLQSVTSQIGGPVLRSTLQRSGFPDVGNFMECCQRGFPFVGDLPTCEGAVETFEFPDAVLSVEELRSARLDTNSTVVSKLKEMPFSEDILPITLGAMKRAS